MYTYNKFKFTLTRNESEEETLEDQDSFCWYFFDSPGIGYDVFQSGSIEGAISMFRTKYARHISEVVDWTCELDEEAGSITVLNSYDGMSVNFSIQKV